MPNVFVGLGYNTLANGMLKFLIYRMLRNSTGNANMRVGSVADHSNTLQRTGDADLRF